MATDESADAAAASAAAAALSYDDFDDRYLGAKSSDPTLDNDGNALLTGALYWKTVGSVLRVWNGAAWADAVAVSGVSSVNRSPTGQRRLEGLTSARRGAMRRLNLTGFLARLRLAGAWRVCTCGMRTTEWLYTLRSWTTQHRGLIRPQR
jgi:hypothetical protein